MNSARGLNANLRVCCRVRPVAIGDHEKVCDNVLHQETDQELLLFDPRHKGVNRRFGFDKVFCQEHTLKRRL